MKMLLKALADRKVNQVLEKQKHLGRSKSNEQKFKTGPVLICSYN